MNATASQEVAVSFSRKTASQEVAVSVSRKTRSLREQMIARSKSWGWLDYLYTREHRSHREYDVNAYEAYLEGLDDEDLLETFLRVEKASDQLD